MTKVKQRKENSYPLPTPLSITGTLMGLALLLLGCSNDGAFSTVGGVGKGTTLDPECSQTTTGSSGSSAICADPESQKALLQVESIDIAAGESDGSQIAIIRISPSRSKGNLGSFCSSTTDAPSTTGTGGSATSTTTTGGNTISSRPCQCQFSWDEINESSGSRVVIPKNPSPESLFFVDPSGFEARCETPAEFALLPTGTKVQVRVTPAPGNFNSTSFALITQSFQKGQASQRDGNFKDEALRSFFNIHRYSCVEQNVRAFDMKSAFINQTVNERSINIAMSNEFCPSQSQNASGGSGAGSVLCANDNIEKASAQTFYYNLYVQSDRLGDIAPGSNDKYTCPRVKEALNADLTNVGEQGQFWPLDTTFALSTEFSTEYPIGVESPSLVGEGIKNTRCQRSLDDNENLESDSSSASITTRCIGYAKRPLSNGSCPKIKITGKDGRIFNKNTYRLRKLLAQQPISFDSAGNPIKQPLGVDVVYVLDRPVMVKDAQGNPKNIYTMQGPKPCPYAWFDHSGVTGANATFPGQNASTVTYQTKNGGRPIYLGSNNPAWAGKSVDGVHFPNVDFFGENGDRSQLTCSATIPVVNYDESGLPSTLTLNTSHVSNPGKVVLNPGSLKEISIGLNKVWVRPTDPYSVHYVEDTSFEGCAPAPIFEESSDPSIDEFRDPPLHFARNKQGNVGWCAMPYPTQNPFVVKLDQKEIVNSKPEIPLGEKNKLIGAVQPFTSPVRKNAVGNDCTFTDLLTSAEKSSILEPNCQAVDGVNRKESVGSGRHPSCLIADTRGTAGSVKIASTKTCDRTIVSTASTEYARMPLQAPPPDIERLLIEDPSYGCTITYDEKRGKTGKETPATGCCAPGRVLVETKIGQGPLNAAAGIGTDHTAHLQPSLDRNFQCGIPTYFKY